MSRDPYEAPSAEVQIDKKSKRVSIGILQIFSSIFSLLIWYFPLIGLSIKSLNIMTALHATAFVYLIGGDTQMPEFEQNQFAFLIAETSFVGLLLAQVRWRSLPLALSIPFFALSWTALNFLIVVMSSPLLYD